MLGIKIKIEEQENMVKMTKVMSRFDENKKITETFKSFDVLIEKEDIESFNTRFMEIVPSLFNSVFGSGFPRSMDEYYRYLYYYDNKEKTNIDNRDFTEEGWIRFFQHNSFKKLQKHVHESFNNDIKKINKELPNWFVRFLGMIEW
jgi:hypothetical protein